MTNTKSFFPHPLLKTVVPIEFLKTFSGFSLKSRSLNVSLFDVRSNLRGRVQSEKMTSSGGAIPPFLNNYNTSSTMVIYA